MGVAGSCNTLSKLVKGDVRRESITPILFVEDLIEVMAWHGIYTFFIIVVMFTTSFLIQITVAKNKDPLSPSGVADVINALRAFYQRQAKASTGDDVVAWQNKSPLPEVLYLVPIEMIVSSQHGAYYK